MTRPGKVPKTNPIVPAGGRVIPLLPVTPEEVAYIERGRKLFLTAFPNVGFGFDDHQWDVRSLRKSAHKKSNPNIYFTRHGSLVEPLPPRFGDVLKSLILQNLKSLTQVQFRLDAGRMLWEAVLERRNGDPNRFGWSLLTAGDFLAAEQGMLRKWNARTTYRHCVALQDIIRLLSGVQIVRPTTVRFVTPRPESTERHTLVGQEQAMEKLPSDEAIHGIADIYATLATEPKDRLLACVVALCWATGLRIGEILTLPWNCLVSEGGGEDRRWGLRYNKEKSDGRLKVLETFWLPPSVTPFVHRLVREIRRLTRAAHRRAVELDASPDQFPLPQSVIGREFLSKSEVGELLGLRGGANSVDADKKIPKVKIDGAQMVPATELAEYLQGRRPERGWVVDRGDGTRQGYSESLFVIFRNQMHATRGTMPLLVEALTEQTVNHWLGGHWESVPDGAKESARGEIEVRDGKKIRWLVRPVFHRFGITEKDGSPIQMTSHGFRHWLTTQAAVSGVDDATLARWQNREHRGDLSAYKHLTPQQRVKILRDAIKAGRVKGRIVEMYFAIAETDRDIWLEDQLQAVHVTPFGLCVHDFTLSPCPKALNCLKNCKDFVVDPQNPSQRAQLVQLHYRSKQALDQARQQAAKEEGDLAEAWVADLEETVRGCEAALGAEPAPGQRSARPFPDGQSRFVPLAADDDVEAATIVEV